MKDGAGVLDRLLRFHGIMHVPFVAGFLKRLARILNCPRKLNGKRQHGELISGATPGGILHPIVCVSIIAVRIEQTRLDLIQTACHLTVSTIWQAMSLNGAEIVTRIISITSHLIGILKVRVPLFSAKAEWYAADHGIATQI